MIFGPPGCGKTTRLLQLLEDELRGYVHPSRLAFVTFTRAARHEAETRVVDRLGLQLSDFGWIRTLHSAAFRLLRLRHDQILSDEHWSEFAKLHGYRLTDVADTDAESGPLDLPSRTPDDALRAAHAWGRSRRLCVDRTLARCPSERLSSASLRLFWSRIDAFKAEHKLLDFADLLDVVLDRGLCPPIDVLFVDEAQDLSPQQIEVVELWSRNCARVYVAGDDDQAIYGFQGADPGWLLTLAETCDVERLSQSYRVPVAVHAFAKKTIEQNRERVPKRYEPRSALGRVQFLAEPAAIQAVDGTVSTFVLARNRCYLRRWARELMARAVPFVVEGSGGVSPLSKGRRRAAVEFALRIERGLDEDERVSAVDVVALLVHVATASGLVARGAKARAKEALNDHRWFAAGELRDELNLGSLFEAIARDGALTHLTGLSATERSYFAALIRRFGSLPESRVTLTSIHGSKGREADLVVVLPDLSRATAREYASGTGGREGETRVFYVAITRAREELIVVRPRGRRSYSFPSFRFEEGRL